ncbi:MAG: DUF2207 family protein [Actinocrinis sp.]
MDLSRNDPAQRTETFAEQQANENRVSAPQLPPAVVAVLLNEGKVTEAVVSRAVLALVDDGWLSIDPQDGGVPLLRIARMPAPGQVRPFEHLLFERITQRMGRVGNVPMSALTSDDGDAYKPWWTKFKSAVTAEAHAQGVLARQLPDAAACLVPLLLAGLAAAATDILASGGATIGAGIAAFAFGCVLSNRNGSPRLTEQGQAAAAWWRENGGGLSGAVIADRLPPGALPRQNSNEALVAEHATALPDGFVWSSFAGRWHPLKVGALDVSTTGRPSTAVVLVIAALFLTVPAALAGHAAVGGTGGTLLTFGPAILFGGVLLLGWLPSNRERRRIPKRARFTGQIVKRWTYESGGEDSKTYHCVCVDDGVSAAGLSFRIDRALYHRVQTGDLVDVEFNPRWHKLRRMVPAAQAPPAGPPPWQAR